MRYLTLLILVYLAGCAAEPPEAPKADQGVSSTEEPEQTQTLAERAGAPLFDGMGSYERKISTSDPDAQKYFNQGMVLAFAFNHAESVRSFRAAQTLDPTCAMCFWGEALATGPNINVTSNGKVVMSDDERRNAFAALQKAIELKSNAGQSEQDYIDALAARYNGEPDTDREPLDQAWADAMGRVAQKYPDDMDAASIYAEALMNTMPWNYWADDGNPKPATVKVIESLEGVLEQAPDHPLALHLYIHAVEASSNPGRAEAAADRLLALVPGAGHLVHMPAHIYWRIGRYHDASNANIEAARVDEAYIAQCNAQGFYPALYYPHNIHFLWAASTMEGRSELSIESAFRVANNVNVEQVKQFPTVEFFRTIPLLSYVRFGKWDEILAHPAEPEEFKFSQGIRHYARGVAFASQGDIQKAMEEQAKIPALVETTSVEFMSKRGYPGNTLLQIANDLLLGEIAYVQDDFAKAITHFEAAVSEQDQLPYTEPPFWYYPSRQSLGQVLMDASQFSDAEAVYRKDLADYPRNGWSMFGLMKALEAQGKTAEAAEVKSMFDEVWQMADVELSASRI